MAGALDLGKALSSPFDHVPPVEPELFYQVDDGSGSPAVIHLLKTTLGIQIRF